ncbi:MAG: Panacea domain-containing protein [Porphyromonas sp.]|nr:Panacea domain-containing protein [Porphyromonas sp.]
MNKYEWQKLKEAVLYILNYTGGLDYYRVFKVLYFAEREHLMRYGVRIIADDFCALPYGPVPSHLYNAIKYEQGGSIADVVEFAGEDASNILLPKRSYDADYLSSSDIACLENSIQANAKLSFSELREKSHDSAYNETDHCRPISEVAMARAAGASEDMIEYIREQQEIERVLA